MPEDLLVWALQDLEARGIGPRELDRWGHYHIIPNWEAMAAERNSPLALALLLQGIRPRARACDLDWYS